MKIALTGATGGLGRSLTESLIARGVEVVALGRNEAVGRQMARLGAKFVACEITDETKLIEAFRDCDQVVHSAGLASPWGEWRDFERANVKGTQTVLSAMRATGIGKLVHISTPSIYFDGRPRLDVKESDPIPAPTNLYAKSKLMADELVLAEVEAGHLSAVLVRPRSIYGKYDRTILPRMSRVMRRGLFPIPDGGRAMVDVTAVENVTHFIWLCLSSSRRFQGDAFNVTNGEPMTIASLLRFVAEAMHEEVKFVSVPSSAMYKLAKVMELYAKHVTRAEPLFSTHSVQSIAVSQTLSIAKARSEMNYTPVIGTRESILNVPGL